MIDWTLAAPAIAGFLGAIGMLVFVHRLRAKARRARNGALPAE